MTSEQPQQGSENAAKIEIVQATAEHIEQITPLFVAYREFYHAPPEEARSRAYITRMLDENASVIFLAVSQDGQAPLGFAQLHPIYSSGTLERRWILNDLFVAPSARRMGVGRRLLERVRAFAEETGAKDVHLRTAVDNYPAQALYDSLGWIRDEGFLSYKLRV